MLPTLLALTLGATLALWARRERQHARAVAALTDERDAALRSAAQADAIIASICEMRARGFYVVSVERAGRAGVEQRSAN